MPLSPQVVVQLLQVPACQTYDEGIGQGAVAHGRLVAGIAPTVVHQAESTGLDCDELPAILVSRKHITIRV